jgi:CBS domain containing-hemolysin-like protein
MKEEDIMSATRSLSIYSVDKVDHLVFPEEFEGISTKSSALKVFTDFKFHNPLVIEAGLLITEAERLMKKAHVRLKLVVDDMDNFVGTISLDNFSEERIVQKVASGVRRDELKVADMMIPRANVKALDYSEVAAATIGDIIHVLQDKGEQHCLVVDESRHQIRGVISAADIARRLHIDIPIMSTAASSFYEVYAALKH